MIFLAKKVRKKGPAVASLLLCSLILISCVTSEGAKSNGTKSRNAAQGSRTSEGEGSCKRAYEEASESNAHLVGYGTSVSASAAVDSARADLVLQIRARVQGSTSVSETSRDVTLNSDTRSDFSEEIVGLKVLKRCERGGRHEAVVQLSRMMLLKNLSGVVAERNQSAASFLSQLQDQNSSPAASIRQLIAARKYVRDHLFHASDNLALCRNFGGCKAQDLKELAALEAAVNANFTKLQFKWRGENDLANKLKSTLLLLLRKEGFATSHADDQASAGRIASTSCFEKVFPKAPGMKEIFVEISCRIEGLVDGNQVFSLTYGAKGFGANIKEAANMAAVSLERETAQ